MKRLSDRIHRFTERATQVRQTLESLPPKLAEAREAVVGTAAQLQALRNEFQVAVGTLRAETDDQLLRALREIDENLDVLREAGSEVTALDLELGPARKLLVGLSLPDSQADARWGALIQANSSKPTLRALLSALQKSAALLEAVELEHFQACGLVVEIGLLPCVQIAWEPIGSGDLCQSAPSGQDLSPAPAPAGSPTPSVLQTGPSTFFAPREIPGASRTDVAIESVSAAAETPGATEPTKVNVRTTSKHAWSAGALQRFKKMPSV